MLRFNADDWYEIRNRGRVASIEKMPEGFYDPNQFKGMVVDIDGEILEVVGVESFMINRSPTFPYRKSFGLLVKESLSPYPDYTPSNTPRGSNSGKYHL